MRPETIANFERLWFVTLAIGVFQSWLGRSELGQEVVPSLLAFQALVLALAVATALFISRRRSKVAKWVLVSMVALGSLMMAIDIISTAKPMWVVWLNVLQIFGQAMAAGLLFTKSARRWINFKPVRA
jgi:ABC-type multidrug transport system permease subunit